MCHVLIIEDEALVALAIELALEDAGADSFDIACTEDEAVEAARRRRPDLITSDVALIEGTGPAAVRTIHEEQGEMPVIFLTGTPEDCDSCAPPAVVLRKPFDAARLVASFRKVT